MDESERNRPEQLPGMTIKHRFTDRFGTALSLYITINFIDELPYEVFIDCKNVLYSEHLKALTYIINLSLSRGVALSLVAEELCGVFSLVTTHEVDGLVEKSLYAGIGQVFKRYIGGVAR